MHKRIAALAFVVLLSPIAAIADIDADELLASLDEHKPATSPVAEAPAGYIRITSNSGKFSLDVASPTTARGAPHRHSSLSRDSYWNPLNTANPQLTRFDLDLMHNPEGSWIKGHMGGKSRDGMRGVLRAEQTYAKDLIDAKPEDISTHVSLESYRASALYCGTLRHSTPRHCCSLVHVALHGDETVRLHSLIVATTESERDALVREVATVLETLSLHP